MLFRSVGGIIIAHQEIIALDKVACLVENTRLLQMVRSQNHGEKMLMFDGRSYAPVNSATTTMVTLLSSFHLTLEADPGFRKT